MVATDRSSLFLFRIPFNQFLNILSGQICQEFYHVRLCLPENTRAASPRPIGHGTIGKAVKSTEAQVILDALKRNENSRLAVARELGIHKSTLYRKIKRLGINLADKKRQIHRR
jgi:transcriptional regulator with PAS, ATPase and Fis domain